MARYYYFPWYGDRIHFTEIRWLLYGQVRNTNNESLGRVWCQNSNILLGLFSLGGDRCDCSPGPALPNSETLAISAHGVCNLVNVPRIDVQCKVMRMNDLAYHYPPPNPPPPPWPIGNNISYCMWKTKLEGSCPSMAHPGSSEILTWTSVLAVVHQGWELVWLLAMPHAAPGDCSDKYQ